MKSIKIYLIVVTVLLVIAIGLGVYVWYLIQNVGSQIPTELPAPTASKVVEPTGQLLPTQSD